MMSYSVRRLCTNARLEHAAALVGEALALKQELAGERLAA